jgi:hypothetical protein
MAWAWKPIDPSIHIYYKVEKKYRMKYHKIYNHFLEPLYNFKLCSPSPCMIDKALAIIGKIGDWYLL